ncbi:tRNA U34 5-methylaminomethyl-2-thiouridine-forming methyltransferase MnmC [Paracoccus sediminis]|uniref:tRNA U34 5-methylaminomethyl-2-thiouridine-forming methyltransferase MnmC n=2 Tax=Paracoccus sediminis TaxID=1214787 RepID=A0A238W2S5_9RHOB|nr:tRNA U34 5-methylaminomethyl-2-thiouridine-forming methyltransferase MnmC [Paracoccus sediminis]
MPPPMIVTLVKARPFPLAAAMSALPDTDPDRHPQLDWRDGGVPVSTRFDDPYFSIAGGLQETRHVFLAGNNLPARLRPGFHVAELGLGTGLNCLALAQVARQPVAMTSFEAWPMSVAQLEQAHAAFPELAALSRQFRDGWGKDIIQVGHVALRMVVGDVARTLPGWRGRADAWFLDGFSPAKNPRMWDDGIMAHVGRCTAPGGTFATYTAAGAVRRALGHAGFAVERRPGFGRKRHMSVGIRP